MFCVRRLGFCLLDPTPMSLINVESLITVQDDKLSKNDKRAGLISSSISVQVHSGRFGSNF